ncbi:MAG: hypothetical protein VX543_02405 [Cyanobacteriota bacterium]|nr:hypothetical protein [Cyanobacteriota bacterium]
MIVVGSSGLSHAQNSLPLAQTRAANLARMRAELINGGLGVYRADQCMYVTGAEECLVSTTNEGFRFQFRGGAPGWQQLVPAEPTLETEVIISRDGERIIAVPYNGPLR